MSQLFGFKFPIALGKMDASEEDVSIYEDSENYLSEDYDEEGEEYYEEEGEYYEEGEYEEIDYGSEEEGEWDDEVEYEDLPDIPIPQVHIETPSEN